MERAIRNAIRAIRFARSLAIETPIFIARQAHSHESLEFLIRANHATKLESTTPRMCAQQQALFAGWICGCCAFE